MNTCGTNFRVTIFGQSHSEMIGATLDGLPAGQKLDLAAVARFMQRRASAGKENFSTTRTETDCAKIICGLVDEKTCGAPLTAVIENSDSRSTDYAEFRDKPRPAHADYPASVKFNGVNDWRGGGQFSGRLTAPLVFAGAVALQFLQTRGVKIAAHLLAVGDIRTESLSSGKIIPEDLSAVAEKKFPALTDDLAQQMQVTIAQARAEQDSLGGIVEVAAWGLPVGIGEPMFSGIENILAQLFFAIPAVRGVEFGAGFAAAAMRGSQHNDAFCFTESPTKPPIVKTRTNNHGGILGGITTGMPIIARVAFKPTPSIARRQNTVNLRTRQNDELSIKGRHDPCIAPRAVPVVEAAVAIGLLDLMLPQFFGGDS